jgi:uncharacterized alkaline shock family protein YloU
MTDPHTDTVDESSPPGEIKINHTVIASIVRFAALEVPGVCSVASGLVDHLGGIGEIFSKKDLDRGVRVQENAEGLYEIEIRVIMAYGTELAKTAQNVQLAIRNQINTMTGKDVARVDVVIDGVKVKEEKREAKKAPPQWVETPKTD